MRHLLCCAAVLALFLAPSVRADEAAEARAIIDKALKAHGGADNLNKFKTATAKMKGKVEANGMTIDYVSTLSTHAPDKLRIETELEVAGMKFTVLQILNGDKGWLHFMDKTMEVDKDQLAEAKEHLHAMAVASLAPLSDKAFKLSPLGEIKIGEQTAVGVLVAHKDRRDVNLYFDKQTGLLLKSETRSKEIFGGDDKEFTAETLYSGYKDFGGAKHATKFTLKRDGKDYSDLEVTDYQSHDKLDDSLFAKP